MGFVVSDIKKKSIVGMPAFASAVDDDVNLFVCLPVCWGDNPTKLHGFPYRVRPVQRGGKTFFYYLCLMYFSPQTSFSMHHT